MFDAQLLFSLITGIFVGGAAGYLGSLMISKKMALVGDALGHVALPGMGLALLFGLNISFGAFIFLLFGILLIWFLEYKTELSTETLVGIIFVLSLAVGFIITPELELLHALIGDISLVSFYDAAASVVLSIFVFIAVYKIYSKISLVSISEELAVAAGINIRKYNLIYLLLIAVIVALGVKVTGSLLVGALVIIPAAASRNLSRNLKEYSWGSAAIGVFGSAFGILLFQSVGLSCGPLIILTSVLIFLLSLIFKE